MGINPQHYRMRATITDSSIITPIVNLQSGQVCILKFKETFTSSSDDGSLIYIPIFKDNSALNITTLQGFGNLIDGSNLWVSGLISINAGIGRNLNLQIHCFGTPID